MYYFNLLKSRAILSENSGHFVNLLSLGNNYFFLTQLEICKSRDPTANSQKLKDMQTTYCKNWSFLFKSSVQ